MATNDKKLEIAFEKAMEQLEAGISVPEILRSFPTEAKEIEPLLQTALKLARTGEVRAPEALLSRLLEKDVSSELGVTMDTQPRYVSRGDRDEHASGATIMAAGSSGLTGAAAPSKGRVSIRNRVVDELVTILMKSRTWVPIGIVVVLVAIFAFVQFGGDSGALSLSSIDDEASRVEEAGDDFDMFLDGEMFLFDEVDATLASEFGAGDSDALDRSAIEAEASTVDEESGEIDAYLTEEEAFLEVDEELDSF